MMSNDYSNFIQKTYNADKNSNEQVIQALAAEIRNNEESLKNFLENSELEYIKEIDSIRNTFEIAKNKELLSRTIDETKDFTKNNQAISDLEKQYNLDMESITLFYQEMVTDFKNSTVNNNEKLEF